MDLVGQGEWVGYGKGTDEAVRGCRIVIRTKINVSPSLVITIRERARIVTASLLEYSCCDFLPSPVHEYTDYFSI